MRTETSTTEGEQFPTSRNEFLEAGLAAGKLTLREQVKTWERYTDEKADVARDLMRGVKALVPQLSPDHDFRTLSIGPSEEPQFKLLHALSNGGLWLYDKDTGALDALKAFTDRHLLRDVHLKTGDYLEDLATPQSARTTLAGKLGGVPFDLITLHHVLYYCAAESWPGLVARLNSEVLSAPGMMHLALMSSPTGRPHTTTWLYNRFARKFFGTENSQNLLELPERVSALTDDLSFSIQSNATRFRPTSFREMMAVVWMIMLYPSVHDFDTDQRTEITEFVLDEFWLPGRELVQVQDYLTAIKKS